jgi:hypothetical protein
MMGRSPYHVAGFLTLLAAGADVFGLAGEKFRENVLRYDECIRDNGLYVSYVIIPPWRGPYIQPAYAFKLNWMDSPHFRGRPQGTHGRQTQNARLSPIEIHEAQTFASCNHTSRQRIIAKRSASKMRRNTSHVANTFDLNSQEYEPHTIRCPSIERYLRQPQKACRVRSRGQPANECNLDQIHVGFQTCRRGLPIPLEVRNLPLCNLIAFSPIVSGPWQTQVIARRVPQSIVVMSPVHRLPQ